MAFNTLPIELNKEIASYIADDKDIGSFRLVCQSTRNAIDFDNGSFWRGRYATRFDTLGDGLRDNHELKKAYQERSTLIKEIESMKFTKGVSHKERDALNLLKELIVESFNGPESEDEYGRPTCKNVELLRRCALSSNLIEHMFKPSAGEKVHTTVETIQIVLAHLSLDFNVTQHAYIFEESQKQAYATTSLFPVFKGKKKNIVNMTWLRHILNFFRHHFVEEKDGLLYRHLKDLAIDDLPSGWTGKLENGVKPLETHWKGTYAYLEHADIAALRARPAGERFFNDGHLADDGEQKDPIQTLDLDFSQKNGVFWPYEFEQHLPSTITRTVQKHNQAQRPSRSGAVAEGPPLHFEGRGTDDEDFLSAGHLNALPSQLGIPGWQRMTMMKYYRTEGTDAVDMEALWAYEGVVLPGGKIILGRWWAPDMSFTNGDSYSGPFILWNVAGPRKVERADSVMDGC